MSKLDWKKLNEEESEADGNRYDFNIQKNGDEWALTAFDSKVKDNNGAYLASSLFDSKGKAQVMAEEWEEHGL